MSGEEEVKVDKDDSAKETARPIQRMDFYYFNGAPWSLRTAWALSLLPKAVYANMIFHKTSTANKLKSKVKAALPFKESDLELANVSVPMLFFTNEQGQKVVIRDGIEIIRFCAERYEPTENEESAGNFRRNFLDNFEEIAEWSLRCERVLRYFRSFAMDHEDDSAKYFVPNWISWVPYLTPYLSKRAIRSPLSKKYYNLGKEVPITEIEETFATAAANIEANGFVLGDSFSYADIVVSVMVEFVAPMNFHPALTMGAIFPSTVKDFATENEFFKKFPKLYEHRKNVFEQHFPENALEVCKMKLTKSVPDITKLWNK